MALYGVGGKPGSGKSFWVVHHMVTKYFSWDKIHGEWVRKFPVEICSNIDDLRLDHFVLDEMIEKSGKDGKGGTVETFFTVDYQRSLLKRFPRILYLIDEAGKYFPKSFKGADVLYFFQYHRHLGIDIYLISSALEDVSPGLLRLMEFRLLAKERSRRVLNEFRYEKYIGGIRAGSTVLKGEARIFHLYKSMLSDETEKIPSVTRRYAVYVLCFVAAGVLLFRYTVYSMTSPKVADSSGVHRTDKAKVLSDSTKNPALKAKTEAISATVSGAGVPLAERGVKGVTHEQRVVSEWGSGVDLLRLKSDYVQVRISAGVDGNSVVYCDDGRCFPVHEIPWILREALRVGEALYVKRKVLEEPKESRADRMGAPAGGVSGKEVSKDRRAPGRKEVSEGAVAVGVSSVVKTAGSR